MINIFNIGLANAGPFYNLEENNMDGRMLYLPNGFVNAKWINDLDYPFVFCLGGRGTGKTYGAPTLRKPNPNT